MKLVISLLFCVLFASCPSKTKNENQKTDGIVNIFEAALFGSGEEGLKKGNLIITSQEEWNNFLKKVDTTNKISHRFRDLVDFSKDMVLVAVDKVRNTGGFGIKISEMKVQNDKVYVKVVAKGPKKGLDNKPAIVTTIITQPINIVKINKTDKEIIFVQ